MKESKEHLEPSVTIGVPVFNGERFIGRALDTLLSQTYGNFEMIISDNASTDRTGEICLSYVSRDDRIRYYRSEQNMGPVWNFNRVFELAVGEYFMWASHDDYWDASYINSCVETFKKSQNVILVGVICKSIDSETGCLRLIDEGFSTVGLCPRERFVKYKSVIHSGKHIGAIFYGLYKRDALKEVMPLRNIIATDHLILAELCLLGEFETVQKMCFVKRQGGTSASIRQIAKTINIKNRLFIQCPYLVREALFQRLIFLTKKLKVADKISLSSWSLANYLKMTVYQGYPSVLLFLNRVLPRRVKWLVKQVLGFRQKSVQPSHDEKGDV
jgi:glycosyltransferase involved in cell wall biosynthesis